MEQMCCFASSEPTSSFSKYRCATESSASLGHSSNQSMVQQLISDGNMRQRTRNAEPTGDMQSTMCRFSRTREMKSCRMPSLVSGTPASLQKGRTPVLIFSHSSLAKRLGTSPELRMLLTSSTIDSLMICVSEKRKTIGAASQPAWNMNDLRSSCHAFMSYVRVISMPEHLYSHIDAPSRTSDWRPEPPTPTSSALPRGICSTREMRQMCSTAKRKSTSFIGLDEIWL
mmetsp:Transcript_14668/g.43745  ORF Transcript_14668/g.43745 Transcript_14668/m.43745 type:complete len:228 (-) Transcript_14668:2604-3287(-)